MGNQIGSLPDDDTTSLDNLNFYQNKLKSTPDGDFIDNIHKNWFGNYTHLEDSHSFIQWLFPIRESGMNFKSQPLTKHEASILRNIPEVRTRILISFELMLDFYGMYLDRDSRIIYRSSNESHFIEQYKLLKQSYHNYLRITRILKCLGIFSFEDLKFRWLNHLVLEIFKYNQITQAARSCVEYWIPTLRRKSDILKLDALVEKYTGVVIDRDHMFGWGDEQGSNWSTEFYSDPLDSIYNKSTEFEVFDEIFVAENDPYAEMREYHSNNSTSTNTLHSNSLKNFVYKFSSSDEENDSELYSTDNELDEDIETDEENEDNDEYEEQNNENGEDQ